MTAGATKPPSSVATTENVLADVGALLSNMSVSEKQPEPAPAEAPVSPVSIPKFVEKPAVTLQSSSFTFHTVAPVLSESYAKACQTDAYEPELEDEDVDEEFPVKTEQEEQQEEEGQPEPEAAAPEQVLELTPAQQKEVMQSQEFQVPQSQEAGCDSRLFVSSGVCDELL